MSREEIPPRVLQFLDSFIDSIEQLQVLLILHSNPARAWSIGELTAELRSTDISINKRLSDLYSRKVLLKLPELKDKHRFSPGSSELHEVIGELARENQIRPYRVIEAIYSRPSKILRDFADAFKFRGDKS